MKKRILFFLCGLSVLFLPARGRAVDLGNGFSLSNVTFFDFTRASGDLMDDKNPDVGPKTANANKGLADGFHFGRVYLTMMKQVNDQLLIRITTDQMTSRPDGSSEASPFGLSGFAGAGRGNVLIKYAYAQYRFSPNLMIRAGQTQTPWIDEAENRWTMRFLRPTFWDEQGAITASDLGVSLMGNLGKLVGYHLMVSNGEGYENNGIDGRGAAGQGRIDLKPFPGLTLSAFGLTETVHAGVAGWNEDREIFSATYAQELFRVSAEYMMADDKAGSGANPLTIMTTPGSAGGSKGPATSTNTARFDQGRGYGAWAWTRIPRVEPLRVFGRFYTIKPNTMIDAGKMIETNGGISYDLSKEMIVAIDDTILSQKLLRVSDGTIQTFKDNILGVRAQFMF